MIARLALAVSLVAGAPVAAESETGEPADYKLDYYRSPVPDTLEGVTVVDDDAAYALWKTGAVVFVDVLPKPPKPKLPKGTIFREKPRYSIPDSVWLPNVGYGRLADVTDAYFRENLAANLPAKDTPVVFFCLRECWMSWNAAKRAREEYGYARVFWYPDGTDGWQFYDYPMEKTVPVEQK